MRPASYLLGTFPTAPLSRVRGHTSPCPSPLRTDRDGFPSASSSLQQLRHLITGLEVKSPELFQFEHGGERSQRLRRRLERLVVEVKEEDLARMVHVLGALVH